MGEWEQEPVEVKARESEDNRGLSLRVAGGIGHGGEHLESLFLRPFLLI